MHILRPAIEKVASTVPEEKWIAVIMNISPTSILVSSDDVRPLATRALSRSRQFFFSGCERTAARLSHPLPFLPRRWSRYEVNSTVLAYLFDVQTCICSFCGIIVHCADNSFKCHVFYCQPSCVQLCKNIEAACKVIDGRLLARPLIAPGDVSSSYATRNVSTLIRRRFGQLRQPKFVTTDAVSVR